MGGIHIIFYLLFQNMLRIVLENVIRSEIER
jgi:hypothetical protein